MYFKIAALLVLSLSMHQVSAADIHAATVTSSNKKSIFARAQKSPNLTAEEKQLLSDYSERIKKQDPKYSTSLVGKNVGQMIAEQSAWAAQQRAKEAEEQLKGERTRAAQDALRDSLAFTLHEKSVAALATPADPEAKQVKFWCTCLFRNTSARAIKAVRGMVVLTDLFGKKIATLGIEVAPPALALQPGDYVVWKLSAPYSPNDPGDLKLNNTSLDALRVEWLPMHVIFTEGVPLGENVTFTAGVKILYDEELLKTDAQESIEGGTVGGGVESPSEPLKEYEVSSPPKLLTRVDPTYPEEARQEGKEGKVNAELIVDENGTVLDVRILSSDDQIFEMAARTALMQWRYSPAMNNGRPVRTYKNVSVVFSLH